MDKKKLTVLILLALAQFILVLDTTFMNVAISTLVKDLHTTVTSVQGAIAFYSLVMAAFMIGGAKIGDIIGRKKAFIIGLIIYGAGALITTFSQNVQMLMFGWSFLEGIGAALIIPAMVTMVVSNFAAGTERIKAYGILAAISAIGAALGPIIGGFLTTYISWRLGFFSELFIVLYILINHKKINDAVINLVNKKFDYFGFLLSVVGLATIVVGILMANTYGLIHARTAFVLKGTTLIQPGGLAPTIWLILIGLVFLILFIDWEIWQTKKNKATLVDPKIFKVREVTFGVLTNLFNQFILAGVIFAISMVAQIVLEYNAFSSGLLILPLSISVLIVALLGGKLAKRFYPKSLIQVGLFLVVLGTVVLGILIYKNQNTDHFISGLVIIGAGIGLVASQLSNTIQSSVPIEKSNEASGINSTFQYLGSSMGTAICGVLIISIFAGASIDLVNKSSVFNTSQKKQISGYFETKAQTVSNAQLDQYLSSSNVPENGKNELLAINNQAENKGIVATLIALAILGSLGLITSSFLPKKKITT